MDQVAEIDETIKTLHEIISVSTEAWNVADEVEDMFGLPGSR